MDRSNLGSDDGRVPTASISTESQREIGGCLSEFYFPLADTPKKRLRSTFQIITITDLS